MTNKRLISLDVFRGATIVAMILVNNIEGKTYSQLLHSEWNGLTFADTIFPFFLWIVGVAIIFSFKKRRGEGATKIELLWHAARRSIILFMLGLFLNGYPYLDLGSIRIMGILQRIAICYLIASIIFIFTRIRTQIILLIAILIGYILLLEFDPILGFGAGHLELGHNIAQYVDTLLFNGHMLEVAFDPEGIISTFGAIATVLFGGLIGEFLVEKRGEKKKFRIMLVCGIGLIAIGLVMNVWLFINKDLWTSTFAVVTAGLATLAFAILYFIVDIKKYQKWSIPFTIFGMNAITIYVLSSLLTRTLMIIQWNETPLKNFIYDFYLHIVSPINATLFVALTHVLFFYIIAYIMYRRKWFIKI